VPKKRSATRSALLKGEPWFSSNIFTLYSSTSQARSPANLLRDHKLLPQAGRRQLSAPLPITHHDRATYVNDLACEEFEVPSAYSSQVQVSNDYQYIPPSFGLPDLDITSDHGLWYPSQPWIDDAVIDPASPRTAFSGAAANDSDGGPLEYSVHGLPAPDATYNTENSTVAKNTSNANGWPNIHFTALTETAADDLPPLPQPSENQTSSTSSTPPQGVQPNVLLKCQDCPHLPPFKQRHLFK
jgi:hypothetical protein